MNAKMATGGNHKIPCHLLIAYGSHIQQMNFDYKMGNITFIYFQVSQSQLSCMSCCSLDMKCSELCSPLKICKVAKWYVIVSSEMYVP